ncbi:class I SAM-dependent methyltransferase [Patescibacteria group bacterium]|nr:class I SAM-dependent methyltransferase [Patescibacteria group bacterium]MBU1870607.1 class I SAM-dependent methyltransferase [Patescibacteria group bacterium]
MVTMLAIFIFIFLLTFVYAGIRGAPWVPTKKKDIERFLKLAKIIPNQKIYDLGCGDGRLICAAAKVGAEAQGFEISLFPYLLANIYRIFQKNKSKIKISYKDFWYANLNNADIVYFFLMPKIYPKLKQKLEKELKHGAKVITYVWPIKEWTPIKVDVVKGYPNLYLYQRY